VHADAADATGDRAAAQAAALASRRLCGACDRSIVPKVRILPGRGCLCNAPAAEVVTDDLRQLASRFWAGVGLMVLGADEPPSSAVAVRAAALGVTSALSGFG